MKLDLDLGPIIVKAAVEEFTDNYDMQQEISALVRAKVDHMSTQILDETLRSHIEEAVKLGLEQSYYRYDAFGKQVGEPTSISIEMQKLLKGYWDVKVNRKGEPDTGYHSVSRAEYFLTQLSMDSLIKSLQQDCVNITAELKTEFRKNLARTMNTTVNQLFNVRTDKDFNNELETK